MQLKPYLYLLLLTFTFTFSCQNTATDTEPASAELSPEEARAKMVARADSLELDTEYELVPGDPLSHHASGFAKILCSAVFITGLDFDFAAENIGYKALALLMEAVPES